MPPDGGGQDETSDRELRRQRAERIAEDIRRLVEALTAAVRAYTQNNAPPSDYKNGAT
jgi:hypothetical protein